MKEQGALLECVLTILGTALTMTTIILRPSDPHFHISGALLVLTGSYSMIARKLPHEWIYGMTSSILALTTTAYSIYAFVTRTPGIRHFFIIFFVETVLTICAFFVACRQIRQLFTYNFNIKKCLSKKKKTMSELSDHMEEEEEEEEEEEISRDGPSSIIQRTNDLSAIVTHKQEIKH